MTGKYILNEHILLKTSKTVIPFSPELNLDFSVTSPCSPAQDNKDDQGHGASPL